MARFGYAAIEAGRGSELTGVPRGDRYRVGARMVKGDHPGVTRVKSKAAGYGRIRVLGDESTDAG